MEPLEEAAGGALTQLDQFWAGMREILDGEMATGAKMEKIRRLREKAVSKIEGLLKNFEQAAQKKEKELTEQMVLLRQMRDQVTVIRHGVLPLFATQSLDEGPRGGSPGTELTGSS